MLTATCGEFPHQSFRPCWPRELFDTRREFHVEAENQPYIEWLQGVGEGPSEQEEEVVDEGEDEEEEEEKDDLGVPAEDQEDEDDDENEVEIGADEKKADPFNGKSLVRFFMEGMIGDENRLEYRDQVDVVAKFREQSRSGESEKPVALLDNRTHGGTSPMKEKYSRQDQRPLTLDQLGKELSKKRFKLKSDRNDSPNLCKEEAFGFERRILFLTNLEPSTMETILATAPRSHAQALKNFFYKYLKGKASIGVTIPSQGFITFTFDFHVSFFVLKEGEELLRDSRERFDGKSLRQSWDLPLVSETMNASPSKNEIQRLYEAQISVTLTGIDRWIWTAYGISDTYFGSSESLESYDQMKSRTGQPDPLLAGQLAANNLIWTPREYFFKVLEIRMHRVLKEWDAIAEKFVSDISQKDCSFQLLYIDSNTRQEVQRFSVWSTQMVTLLRRLISKLSDTVDAWHKFQRKEIWYFLCKYEPANAPSSLKSSIDAVDDVFEALRDILKKLRDLEKELCQDSPQGLNALYNRVNHEAQIFQQRSAFHIQVLTVITILFIPPALAAAIFSTQGVLPFAPNLARFIEVLFILGILVGVSIAVLYKWQSWFRLIVDCIPRWPRKIDVPKPWDLETGSGKGRDDLK